MRWLAILLSISLLAIGCDNVSPAAPSGSILVISANPDRIGANGESVITVIARKADGFPVNEGTIIALITNRGEIQNFASRAPQASFATDLSGTVKAFLKGDGSLSVGTATVRASTGAAGEATVDVQIGIFAASITLTPSRSSVKETGFQGMGELELTALVRDDQAQPLEGTTVTFSSGIGSLGSGGTPRTTDMNGVATDTLTATEGDLSIVAGESFDVTVEAGGASGAIVTASATISIQRRPRAAFDFTVDNPSRRVTFEDLSTGQPTDWEWDFGDGTPASTARNPSHVYDADGTYSVRLTVTNSVDEDSLSQTVVVENG